MSFISDGVDWLKHQFSEDPEDDFIDDTEPEEPEPAPEPEKKPERKPARARKSLRAGAQSVRAIRPMQCMVITPRAYRDARRSCQALEDGYVVVLILHHLDDDTASRLVDFMSGAVYFTHGEVDLLNDAVLICTPSTVHLERDNLPQFSGIPTWKGPYA